MRNTVFRALADPTRRAILERLREREHTVSELCAPFAMSQPAVSQHLKVLVDAKLVHARSHGRQRMYALRATRLKEPFEWLHHFERFWTEKLDALGTYLDREGEDG